MINVDETIAKVAAKIAATYRLRGNDAVCAAVSTRFATELVTLDEEQLKRMKKVMLVRKPK